jgi:leucyl-tRNA synthetase
MFMSPLADGRTWDPQGISGCRRFLERLWRVFVDASSDAPIRPALARETARQDWSAPTLELERALNRMLKRIDDSFDGFNFNTAVSGMMTFANELAKRPGALVRDQAERLLLAISPFAPHLAEELWRRLGHERSLAHEPWPRVDPRFLEEEDFELVVQVRGKVRARTRAPRAADRDELERLAREAAASHLEGKQVIKTVVVPGRLVNFVVR